MSPRSLRRGEDEKAASLGTEGQSKVPKIRRCGRRLLLGTHCEGFTGKGPRASRARLSPAFYVHYIIATCCGRICLAVFFYGGMWVLGSAGEGVSVRRELALLQLQDVRRRARRLLQLLRRRAQPCPGLEAGDFDLEYIL